MLLAGKYFGQNFTLAVGAIDEKGGSHRSAAHDRDGEWIGWNHPGRAHAAERSRQRTPGLQPHRNHARQPVHGTSSAQAQEDGTTTNAYIMGGGVNPTGQDNTGNSGGFNQFTLNGTNITQQISYGNQGAGTWNVSPTWTPSRKST